MFQKQQCHGAKKVIPRNHITTFPQGPQGEGPAPNGICSDMHLTHQFQVPGSRKLSGYTINLYEP